MNDYMLHNVKYLALIFVLVLSVGSARAGKSIAKDYDFSITDEVLDLNIRDDKILGRRTNKYTVIFSGLENGVVMTKLRKIRTSPRERVRLGFDQNRLNRRGDFSTVSDKGQSTHLFKVRLRRIKQGKLVLLRLRQFEVDSGDPDRISFVEESPIRINIIPERASSCAPVQTCARLDYIDSTIYRLYDSSCTGGGVAVDMSFCET